MGAIPYIDGNSNKLLFIDTEMKYLRESLDKVTIRFLDREKNFFGILINSRKEVIS